MVFKLSCKPIYELYQKSIRYLWTGPKISDRQSFDQRPPHSNNKRHFGALPLRGTPMIFRGLTVAIMLAVAATGYTRYGVSGPEDLGLAARFNPQTLPTMLDPGDPVTRNQVINQWLLRSDALCAD